MRARFGFGFAFPLVLLFACKKEAPAPAPSASGSAAPLAGSATAPAPGSGLAILKDFEGQIAWAVKGKLAGPSRGAGAPLVLKLLVKGEKFRLDLPPGLPGAPPVGSGYLLGEPQQKKFYVVMDAQKQAVLIDSDKLTAQLDTMGKNAGPAAASDAPEVKKTGKRDTVAGYGCEVWQITHKTSKMELCVAAEDTAWWKLPLAKLPSSYAWATELTDGKHFPLRFATLDKSGAEEGRVELSGIEKKTLDAKAFELPAGYQVIDLEQMMAGLTQGLAGMHGRPGAPSLKGLPGLPKGALGNRPSPPTAPKKKP